MIVEDVQKSYICQVQARRRMDQHTAVLRKREAGKMLEHHLVQRADHARRAIIPELARQRLGGEAVEISGLEEDADVDREMKYEAGEETSEGM